MLAQKQIRYRSANLRSYLWECSTVGRTGYHGQTAESLRKRDGLFAEEVSTQAQFTGTIMTLIMLPIISRWEVQTENNQPDELRT
jgi:hypothetical protein